MRSKQLLKYQENVGVVNDYLLFYIFCSENCQIEIDKSISKFKDFKRVTPGVLKEIKRLISPSDYRELSLKKNKLYPNIETLLSEVNIENETRKILTKKIHFSPIYTTDIFTSNTFVTRFKKELSTVSLWNIDTNIFIFDSVYSYLYLVTEHYFRKIYEYLNDVHISHVKNKLELAFVADLKENRINEEGLTKKLLKLKEDYSRIGKELKFNLTRIKVEKSVDNESFTFKELNTNEAIMFVLESFGLVDYDKGMNKYLLTRRAKTLQQEDIDTLEYIRLRRNTVVHREKSERYKGTIEQFILSTGATLNKYWKSSDPKRKFSLKKIDFETQTLAIQSFDELVDVINILRFLCIKVDNEVIGLLSETEWTRYIYWTYRTKRKKSNKAFDTSNFGRFHAKFSQECKDELNLKVEKQILEMIIKEELPLER